jgi:cytochrome P450 family 103
VPRDVPGEESTVAGRSARPRSLPRLATDDLDRNPHGIFRRFRPLTALLEREDGSYLAIRSTDVERLMVDQRTRQLETERFQSRGIGNGALFEVAANSMMLANGTAHRRRRAPISRAFAYRLITGMRPRIRDIADQLLQRHLAGRHMSLRDDYAALLPARTISMILGLPEHDIPSFTRWVYSLARVTCYSYSAEEVPEMEQAAQDLLFYTSELLAERRAIPRDDFLTDYVAMADQEGVLSAPEILSQLITIMVAGSDTTRTAMVMQVALLLQHREQWDAICRKPALIPSAVSEALRYEPPIGSVPRFALEDIEIGGTIVPARSVIVLSTLSAMRDPALYTDPDRFNILRTDHPYRHLVFGGGPHRCLGEVLARAGLEEGLAALAARLPQLRLVDDTPVITGHAGIRRVSDVRVAW